MSESLMRHSAWTEKATKKSYASAQLFFHRIPQKEKKEERRRKRQRRKKLLFFKIKFRM